MRHSANVLFVIIVVLVVGGIATACGAGGDEGSQGQPSGPIVVGQAASLSGPISAYDAPISDAIKFAIEDYNGEGGVLGRDLKLVTADNKTDLQLVRRTAQDVLDEGADVLIPTCDYDIGGPAAQLANEQGIVALGCAGSPLFGASGLGDLVFNTYQANPTEAASMVQFAGDQGFERPYLLQDTSLEYSKNLCDYFEESYEGQVPGGRIAGKDTFQNPDQSIATQINRLKGSDADSVIVCSYLPGGATALRQLRSSGVDLPVIGGVAFDGTQWVEAVPNLNDFYFPAVASLAGDDPSEEVNEFFDRFEDEQGARPEASISILGYAAIQTFAEAAERAGSTEGEKVAAEIEKFDEEPLIAGPTTYAEDCHIPLGRPMRMMQYENGELSFAELVEPEELPDSPC